MDKYSRQIGAFGLEAMSKLMNLKVLIVGLRCVLRVISCHAMSCIRGPMSLLGTVKNILKQPASIKAKKQPHTYIEKSFI